MPTYKHLFKSLSNQNILMGKKMHYNKSQEKTGQGQ